MIIQGIQTLVYDGDAIGLRFRLIRDLFSSEKVFDTGRDRLVKRGVYSLPKEICILSFHDGLLMSEEEANGLEVEDISKNDQALDQIVIAIRESVDFRHLLYMPKAYDQSLSTFMANPYWVVEGYHSPGNGWKNHMRQPDGKHYGGGWIGSDRNEQKAKAKFHYDQCRSALHRGYPVTKETLDGYTDLQSCLSWIETFMSRLSVDHGDIWFNREDGSSVLVLGQSEEPNYLRMRELLTERKPLSDREKALLTGSTYFNMRELLIMAILRMKYTLGTLSKTDPYYRYLN